MKTVTLLKSVAAACVLIVCATGCRTGTDVQHFPTKYRTTDGRVADIGPRKPSDGGWSFNEPHLDKCWIASGFDFQGYDTLLIMPTLTSVRAQTPEEGYDLELEKKNLASELAWFFRARAIVTNVVTREEEVPPGEHVLKLENTITEFKRGSTSGRFWAGLFGAGQPILRVVGTMTDHGKTVFTFEAHRSGVSADARLLVVPDEQVQHEDLRSMILDVTDFAAAIADKYQPKN
jgi:hypothetical protein